MRPLISLMALVLAAGVAAAASTTPDPALMKQAKVSEEKAREIALKRAPGTVQSSELEKEKGTIVWSFDIKGKRGITEVLVSALDGHVVNVHRETKRQEAAEKKKEAGEKK